MRRALAVELAGVALTLVALTFDASPLFVPGTALIFVGIAAPAWVWLAARPVTLRRRLDAERVIEEEPLEATIELRRGRLGLPCAELDDPLARKPVSLTIALS